MNRYVIVFIKADDCDHCVELYRDWNNIMKNVGIENIVITVKSRRDSLDYNRVPRSLEKFTAWYPMILLIPINKWNEAMRAVPNGYVDLTKDAKVMNGEWKNGQLVNVQKYNHKNPQDYIRWIKS